MKGNNLFILFNIGIFILILETSHAWIFWNVSSSFRAMMYVTIFVVGLLYYYGHRNKCNKSNYYTLAAMLLFIANIFKTESSFLGMGQVLLYIVLLWFVMVLPIEQKKEILKFQTKFLALLLIVSFAAWVAHLYYPMPYTEIQRSGYEHLPSAHNYYFFITTYMGLLDYRFHSIFLEPGHLGCIISFFVLANQFNFRNKYVLILSILLLFTLSLAGFVIFFIGFLLYSFSYNRNSKIFRRLCVGGLLFLGIWLFGVYYNGGNNYVNERIVERLQYDEDTDDIVGNDRYTEVMDRAFEQVASSSDVFGGISISDYRHFREIAGNGAGIKLWIIQKGIFGAFVLFLGYYFIACGSRNKRWAMFMLLVYVISSYQRMYFFWTSYLIPFICGSALPFFTKKTNNKINTIL